MWVGHFKAEGGERKVEGAEHGIVGSRLARLCDLRLTLGLLVSKRTLVTDVKDIHLAGYMVIPNDVEGGVGHSLHTLFGCVS